MSEDKDGFDLFEQSAKSAVDGKSHSPSSNKAGFWEASLKNERAQFRQSKRIFIKQLKALSTDYDSYLEPVSTAYLVKSVERAAEFLELDFIELWRFSDDDENVVGEVYCTYSYASKAAGVAFPGLSTGHYPYNKRPVSSSAELCSLCSGSQTKHCWRTRVVPKAGTKPAAPSEYKDEELKQASRTEVAVLIEGGTPEAALFLVGFALKKSVFNPSKIDFIQACFGNYVNAFSGSKHSSSRSRNNSAFAIESVVPEWKPEYSFSFPVNQLQVRHAASTYFSWTDFKNVSYLCKGTRVDIHFAKMKSKTGTSTVVIKMLKKEAADQAVALQEFQTEHGLLARISHPNIVQLIGAGRTPRPFLVLEHLELGTLASLLKSAGKKSIFAPTPAPIFPLKEAIVHARELAEALDYLHMRCHPDATIIHRDLKPDNVGFTADGTLKLFDLGLCTCIYRTQSASEVFEMTGNTGSLRYMAPEVALRKPYNEKVDVYSYGILVWQLISGDTPFESLTVSSFSSRVHVEGLRPELPDPWPQALRSLLTLCWSAASASRPSFETIVGDITDLVDHIL